MAVQLRTPFDRRQAQIEAARGKQKESGIDKIAKALGIAQQVTGLAVNVAGISESIANRKLKSEQAEALKVKTDTKTRQTEGLAGLAGGQGVFSRQELEQQAGAGDIEVQPGAAGRGLQQVLTPQPAGELAPGQAGTGFVQETIRSGKVAKEVRKEESDLAKDFAKDKTTQQSRLAITAFDKISGSLKLGTGPGDVAAIVGFMKSIDPGSTVREGEFRTAGESGGAMKTLMNLGTKLISGKRIPDEVRAQFLEAARSQVQAQLETQKVVNESFTQRAKVQGLDPRNVVIGGVTELAKKEPSGKVVKSGVKIPKAVKEMSTRDIEKMIADKEREAN